MSFEHFRRKPFAHRRGVSPRIAICLLASCAGLTTIACNQSLAVEWQTQQNHPTTFSAIHPNTILHHPNVRNDVAITTGTLTTNTSGTLTTNTSGITLNATGSTGTSNLPGTLNITTTSGTGTLNLTNSSSGFSASSISAATITVSGSGTFILNSANLSLSNVSAVTTASNTSLGITNTNPPGVGIVSHPVVPAPIATPAVPPASTTPAAVTPVGNVIDTSALNDSAMIGLLNSTNLTLAANGALNRASFAPWKKGSIDQIVSLPAPNQSQPDPGQSSHHEDGDVIIDTDND